MSVTIHPIDQDFVAEVRNIDLAAGIDAAQAESLEQALAEYGVLVFRAQPLNDAQQQRFIERFGPPVVTQLDELKSSKNHNPHFIDIATVDEDGVPIAAESARGMYLLANQLWHTDGSQVQPPVRLTALSARQLPPAPPPTEYANMRGAWEALSPELQALVDGRVAEHSIFHSRAKIGMQMSDFSEATRQNRKAVTHAMVRQNKRTGRKSLYLASHASHIVGMPVEEGGRLIDELTAFATQARFVYAHQWQPNDVVMWDDSWTMHRSTPYTAPHPRVMRWCGVRELQPV